MNSTVIELVLAIVFLCILGCIALALWSIAVALTGLAGAIAGKPLKVELANGGHSAMKVEVELSNPVGGLQVEMSNSNSRAFDVCLEPVELSNHIGAVKLQLDPIELVGGALRVELEKGILPVELKIEPMKVSVT